MRSEADVQDRIRFLLTQEISQRLEEVTARLPVNCIHNERHALDVRKVVEGEPNEGYNRLNRNGKHLPVIGLCMLGSDDPTTWPGNICEDPIDAVRCPYFQVKVTREAAQAEFQRQIQDLDWVSEYMPEVYGLLWALGSETVPQLPWWKQLWYRVLRIRPDELFARRPALPKEN